MKPIRVGLTCWLWERKQPKALLNLAKEMGLNVKVTERTRWLRRDIEAQVSGGNVDHFIGEFARHC